MARESPEAYILYTNSHMAIYCGKWLAILMYITNNCYSKVVVKLLTLQTRGRISQDLFKF